MHTPFGTLWALAMCVAAACPAAGATADCSARYDVSGGGAAAPGFGVTPHTLVLDGDAVDIEGWCRLDGLRRSVTPYGAVRLRRRFRACGPLRAGRFDATLPDACGSIRAVVKTKRKHARLFLSGIRHVPPGTFHVVEDRIFSDRGCA